MAFCAYCGAAVERVSFARCKVCDRPTNGAIRPRASMLTGCLIVGAGFCFILFVVAIDYPSLRSARQRSYQKRTVASMRAIAGAISKYAAERKQYPPSLNAEYVRAMPHTDGWQRPMRYGRVRSDTFVLASAGDDGVFEHTDLAEYVSHVRGATTNFNDDIVLSNGWFIEYPEGVQVQ